MSVEQQIKELNELVLGATKASQQAIVDLQAAVKELNEREARIAQLEKDRDLLQQDVRKFTKQMLERAIRPDGSYRGHWASREQSRHFGLIALGFLAGRESARKLLIDEGVEVKAMGESTEAGGGFIAPEAFSDELIRNIELYGVFRRNARVVPMSRDTQSWPKRTGGLTVYNPAEAGTITASDLTFSNVSLTAKKFAVLAAFSTELEEDAAIALGELLAEEIALAFATKEDVCGFAGTGAAATYFGITGVLNHASTVNQACASTDTTFTKGLAWKYLSGAIGQLVEWALMDARYYMHRTNFWSYVVGQVDSSGNPIVKFSYPAMPAAGVPVQLGGVTPLILGFPVELTSALPASSATAISTAYWLFGSLRRGWFLGDRRQIRVERSREAYFTTDQVGVRGTERIDIAAADATAMVKTTTAAS